jgi:hypothetical protein
MSGSPEIVRRGFRRPDLYACPAGTAEPAFFLPFLWDFLIRIILTPQGRANRSLRASSSRSAMLVAKLRRRSQTPFGAACCPASWREPVMPLLTELENNLVEPPCYKHGAPNGACPSAPMGEMSGLLLFDHGPGVETLGYYYSSLRDEGVRSFVVLEAPEWLGIRGRSAEGA